MADTIWSYFVELRKELLQAQKIRAQVIGFKVTFVATAFGFLFANLDKHLDKALFVVPALAGVFFDFVINSYSFSIKRIGSYVRFHIEPALKQSNDVPNHFVMWQQFLTQPKTRQNLAHYGNLGMTLLSVGIAVVGLFSPFQTGISSILLAILLVFVVADIFSYLEPRKLGKQWADRDFE
jgi:uncharacterized membrane protein